MNAAMERDVLAEKPLDPNFYNGDFYIWQWFQFVYKSQLLLAERKQKRKAETHKTVPCQAWKDTGRCNYGKRCKFAHGPEELRPMPKAEVKVFNNPRYRTALCIKYTTFGYCPYGDQCHFIHNPVQIDLEKCLDWLSGSSLSSVQLSSEQTNIHLDNTSFSQPKSEITHSKERRKRSQPADVTSESKQLKPKLEIFRKSESLSLIESTPGNNAVEATAHDPFQSDTVCSEEIELKPLQFNAFDDFLYVINPQSVLPEKQ
uniref:C3H1-type domain-containing protein n=1 Tax=Elaeophora elaphi TaxID=1147741 RepID=A0A0R3RX92_9BILA